MDREALHQHFAQQSQLPQKFGSIDCVTFCMEGLKVGWDKDYLSLLRYWDRRSAVGRLREAGGLKEAFCEEFGDLVPISELKAGDLVYIDTPPTLGLLLENGVAIKNHYTVRMAIIDPEMYGWRT